MRFCKNATLFQKPLTSLLFARKNRVLFTRASFRFACREKTFLCLKGKVRNAFGLQLFLTSPDVKIKISRCNSRGLRFAFL